MSEMTQKAHELKLNAKDYLKEFASQCEEPWLVLLINQVITGGIPEKRFIDLVYKSFLENNELKDSKSILVPSAFTKDSGSRKNISDNEFRLKSLSNENGVNALIKGATLTFHPKLTVIYGKNGSGKSGFVRVIKKISGSKTQEDIWQNVHKAKTKNQCTAIIVYEKDGKDYTVKWRGESKVFPFDQLNVFDGKSVPIYLTRGLAFSYQPFGFEIFQILTGLLRGIHDKLTTDIEKKEYKIPLLESFFNNKTVVGQFVASINSDTKLDELDKMLVWNKKTKKDLLSKEKTKHSIQNIDEQHELLQNRIEKLSALQDKLTEIQTEFSSKNINTYWKLIKSFGLLKKKFDSKKGLTLEDYKIPEMESEEWYKFIEAGENYINISYKRKYPQSADYCIYCRQKLTKTSIKLLKLLRSLFKESELSNLEKAEENIVNAINELKKTSFVNSFPYNPDEFKKILPEKAIEKSFLALSHADGLIETIVTCLSKKSSEKIDSLNLHSLIGTIEKKQKIVLDNIQKLEELQKNLSIHTEENESAITELLDLKELFRRKKEVKKYIIYKHWIAKANSIASKLNTKTITDLGSKAWKELVSNSFKKQFEKETDSFGAPKINLEFHGEYGSQMREKNLEGLTKIDDFLSEGEQKAVALSDFFAELSMYGKKTPVVFDDPATSFDHERKGKIAKRIVNESQSRQVIIFTHDLMFASNLQELVLNGSSNIDPDKASFHYLSASGGEVGLVTENYYPGSVKLDAYLPKIDSKILKAQQLTGEEQAEQIKFAYEMLRKAVEKIVEERIFGGVITRWSDRIQLLNESRATLDKNKLSLAKELHGKFSGYIEAHNQSDEMIGHSLPEIDNVKEDLQIVKDLAKNS